MGVKFNPKIHLSPLCVFDDFKERKNRALLLLKEGFSIFKVMEISALDFSSVNNLYISINKYKTPEFSLKAPKEALREKKERFYKFSKETVFRHNSQLKTSKNTNDSHFKEASSFNHEGENTTDNSSKSDIVSRFLFKNKTPHPQESPSFNEKKAEHTPYNLRKSQDLFQDLSKGIFDEMNLTDPLCQRIERALVLKKYSTPLWKIKDITHLLCLDLKSLKDSFSFYGLQEEVDREIQEKTSGNFSYALKEMSITDPLENRIKRTLLLWKIYHLSFVNISKITLLNFSDIRSLVKE